MKVKENVGFFGFQGYKCCGKYAVDNYLLSRVQLYQIKTIICFNLSGCKLKDIDLTDLGESQPGAERAKLCFQ